MSLPPLFFFFFFFNDTATTEIYTLSLHDALPISAPSTRQRSCCARPTTSIRAASPTGRTDRKSTRLNSSHLGISYAVFCLKKKKKRQVESTQTDTIGVCSAHAVIIAKQAYDAHEK